MNNLKVLINTAYLQKVWLIDTTFNLRMQNNSYKNSR